MAITGFGVTELNLIGGSGTPKIESSNNLNLSAVTVAISTNATVGGTLDVDGHTELDGVNVVGVATATSFVGPLTGNASSATALQTGREIGGVIFDGTGNITPIGNNIVTSRWTIGANGSSDYTFTGPGGLSGANDPTIYLARGQTYEFVNSSGGSHPFQIRVSNGGSAYSTGVTNNGASSGTIKFEVPFAAPNTLVYQCTAHSGMVGNIVVYPSV